MMRGLRLGLCVLREFFLGLLGFGDREEDCGKKVGEDAAFVLEAEEFLGFLFAARDEALLLNAEIAEFGFGLNASEAIKLDGMNVGGVGVGGFDAFAAGG